MHAVSALILALGMASLCSGQEASLNGTWKLADTEVERKSRQDAISQIAAGVPRFARSRVSEKLRSSTGPTKKLTLKIQEQQLVMREDKREFELTFDSKPVEVSGKNGRGKVSVSTKSGLMVLTAQASDAKRTVTFRPGQAGKTLVLEVTLNIPRIGKTARYKTKYVRQ
ncbi:MAG TPA: hypothetical protein DDW52_21590 [Planctomycetaceae bacterium]|nr:hypothetical protein [Planctomycetaceae bacterium]